MIVISLDFPHSLLNKTFIALVIEQTMCINHAYLDTIVRQFTIPRHSEDIDMLAIFGQCTSDAQHVALNATVGEIFKNEESEFQNNTNYVFVIKAIN